MARPGLYYGSAQKYKGQQAKKDESKKRGLGESERKAKHREQKVSLVHCASL
jgi:hypothetical protein